MLFFFPITKEQIHKTSKATKKQGKHCNSPPKKKQTKTLIHHLKRNKEKHCNSPPKNPGFSAHPLDFYYPALRQVLPLQIKPPQNLVVSNDHYFILSPASWGSWARLGGSPAGLPWGSCLAAVKTEAGDREQRLDWVLGQKHLSLTT